MRNINHTSRQQTSREFYNETLKNKHNSLNSSKKEVNIIENGLDIFLQHSYIILSPLFNSEQELQNFKQEENTENIDQLFDEHIQNISPSWLKQIVLFLINAYQLLFPKKIKKIINNTIKKKVTFYLKSKPTKPNNRRTNTTTNTVNNFFPFKPPT